MTRLSIGVGLALAAVLPATGEAGTITAASCSPAAVQAAIGGAADGDTVVIPAGSCRWTSGVSITGKGIHLTAAAPGAVTITHDAGSRILIDVAEDTSHHAQVSHLRFVQGTGGQDAWHGMFLGVGQTAGGRAVLVHDCSFEITSSSRRAISWDSNRGVIWNNEFTSHRQDANAIRFGGPASSWTTASTMGTRDLTGESNVYLEDNLFREMPAQALDPDSNSRVVIRHNRFEETALASHGADTSIDGARHWELYDNVFTFTNHGDCDGSQTINLPYTFYIRGGTGIIADNVIPDMSSCAWGNKPELLFTVQNIRRDAGPYACWTTYPVPRQVGQSHDGARTITEPVYLWGNTGGGNYSAPGLSDYDPDDCGNDLHTADFIRAGRDYVLNTPKPGYAKFTYPHPLRGGQPTPVGSPPAAPTNLRVVP